MSDPMMWECDDCAAGPCKLETWRARPDTCVDSGFHAYGPSWREVERQTDPPRCDDAIKVIMCQSCGRAQDPINSHDGKLLCDDCYRHYSDGHTKRQTTPEDRWASHLRTLREDMYVNRKVDYRAIDTLCDIITAIQSLEASDESAHKRLDWMRESVLAVEACVGELEKWKYNVDNCVRRPIVSGRNLRDG